MTDQEKPNMIISATAASVRSALAEARRVAGLELNASREIMRSGGEDGLFRVHLADKTIVEVTVVQHGRASAHIM